MPDSPQSRITGVQALVDALSHRVDRVEDTQRAFAGETGARIKAETELAGDVKGLRQDVNDLKDWRNEIEDRLREAGRFKRTTYISLVALLCTAAGVVATVVGVLH